MRIFRASFSYENPLKTRFGDEFFAALPRAPGVYFMKSATGRVLYVGKARCLRTRVSSYRHAKPGSVGENIIELLERVERIDFEEHADESAAIHRERELIRAVVPPYNLADAWEEDYLFVGLRVADGGGALEFRLTSRDQDADEFTLHGCFAQRGRAKSAYSSLLRLLHAANFRRERFGYPARLTRSSPAYNYRMRLSEAAGWKDSIDSFLRGEDLALIERLVEAMLANERIPPYVRPGLQEDLEILMAFQRACIAPAPRGLVTHARMRKRIRASIPR
jgi:excinuclease UvrABC nuclease subunit